MQLGDWKFVKLEDLNKKWVYGEPKTYLQVLFINNDSILYGDLVICVNAWGGSKNAEGFRRNLVLIVKVTTSCSFRMKGMSLIRLPLLSWAALRGTIGVKARMGLLEEELEAKLSPKEDEVFLFILKENTKQKLPWKQGSKNEKEGATEFFHKQRL